MAWSFSQGNRHKVYIVGLHGNVWSFQPRYRSFVQREHQVTVVIPRTKRWDIPFTSERERERLNTDEDADRLLNPIQFYDLERMCFKYNFRFEVILKNDMGWIVLILNSLVHNHTVANARIECLPT